MGENTNDGTSQPLNATDGVDNIAEEHDRSAEDAEDVEDDDPEHGDDSDDNEDEDEDAEDDDNDLGETKRYRIPRTGDRDIIFTGKLIGIGEHHAGYQSDYVARIFATEGGKFIATRWHTQNHSTTHLAQVCESAETVAAFFHITPPTPEVKRGQRAEPPMPYLCEDGKKAIEGAASFFDDFEALYLEDVD